MSPSPYYATPSTRLKLRALLGNTNLSDIDAAIAALVSDMEANVAGYTEGTSLPAAGASGRVFRVTGTDTFYIDDGTVWKLLASAPVAAVTSVPSVADGQAFDLLADDARGVVWRFRKRSASASAYKNEFVGGAPIFATLAARGVASGSYVEFAGAGERFTLPCNGEFLVQFGGSINNDVNVRTFGGWLTPSVSGTMLDANAIFRAFNDNSPRANFSIAGQAFVSGSVGQTIGLGSRSDNGGLTINLAGLWYAITPIRVS